MENTIKAHLWILPLAHPKETLSFSSTPYKVTWILIGAQYEPYLQILKIIQLEVKSYWNVTYYIERWYGAKRFTIISNSNRDLYGK